MSAVVSPVTRLVERAFDFKKPRSYTSPTQEQLAAPVIEAPKLEDTATDAQIEKDTLEDLRRRRGRAGTILMGTDNPSFIDKAYQPPVINQRKLLGG